MSSYTGEEIEVIREMIEKDTLERIDGHLIRLILNYATGLGVVDYPRTTRPHLVAREDKTEQDVFTPQTTPKNDVHLKDAARISDVEFATRLFPPGAQVRADEIRAQEHDMQLRLLGVDEMPVTVYPTFESNGGYPSEAELEAARDRLRSRIDTARENYEAGAESDHQVPSKPYTAETPKTGKIDYWKRFFGGG